MARNKSYLRHMFPSEYAALKNAIYRCYDHTHPQYNDYGGRGTTVCDEWRSKDGFAAFLDHVGPRPSPRHSLDRINNLDGHYAPNQVRWTGATVQNNNRRPAAVKVRDYGWGIGQTPAGKGHGKGSKYSPLLVLDGRSQTLAEWARERSLLPATVRRRLDCGLTVENALDPSTSRKGLKHKRPYNSFMLPTKH